MPRRHVDTVHAKKRKAQSGCAPVGKGEQFQRTAGEAATAGNCRQLPATAATAIVAAVANTDLERLARLASIMDNCTTSLAVLSNVVSVACPEEVETVQYITHVHAEDGQQARSAMRDVAAAAIFDIIRRHVLHGWALAFPLRECVALPSARANEILQSTSAAYGREKHVLCGVTVMDFVSRNILGIVVQALASTRAWAAEQGLLLRAEHGSPSGDGLVLAGGCIHNALQPVPQRLSGAQADADIFARLCNIANISDEDAAHFWASVSVYVVSLPSTCTAVQYREALQQHRLLPGDVELAVLAHALNIALTVFDPDGLQICYWGTSTVPTEVCLIRQMGLAGTPVSYCLLDMLPDAEQHIPGYFGASWRSGAGHSLGISVQLAAWSAVTSVLLASALVVCTVCGVTSTDLHDDLNGNERAEYLAFHPPDYTKAIVSLDAIDQLRIGLVDVGLGFFPAAFGFVAGKLQQQHCMEALVLDWAHDSTRCVNMLPPALQEVLGWSMQHNPLVREFLTVAEQVPPNHPLPYLSPADVQSFVASEQACKPLVLATLETAEAAHSLISVVVPAIQHAAMKHAPVMYTAGTLVPWVPTRPELNLAVAADGSPLDYQFGLSVEMAMFPYLFPFGVGAFMGGTTLVKYLAYRAKCLFSVWKAVLAAHVCASPECPAARAKYRGECMAVLESVLLDYKSQHPNASDEDAIRHILKHKLPATLPNTPAWHRSNLQDLLCMVDRFGMLSFFEHSQPMKCLPHAGPKSSRFCAGFTWQDAPAENAFIAHKCMQSFMTDMLKAGRGAVQAGGALGRVTNWVDVDRVASEIVACVPAVYRGDDSHPLCPYTAEYWQQPEEPCQHDLFHHVLRKQMHICLSGGHAGCCASGVCKYKFPWAPNQESTPVIDPATLRYQYYRPSWVHQNVVPYHPTLALLWGAHMNIQRINSGDVHRGFEQIPGVLVAGEETAARVGTGGGR
ncbi:hypothetical protein VOLCADRAFT_85991 [Volvox carteri f. nagariensis]|uniref:Uncharacterized protein n=1 Tax=Volvox carteri f. nagariensis TaxID=3068 RepID=D8THJ1_VOLCA|nr:uncharacterized protein VOLCADRAFT_85991 [Volvox carteri f. nagariensis]EFJ53079.1 hypothetical protein VOLCADRAFT_85991 [Volvox carteri f. nagariensis]|eukprot:XP_002946084.1 hypothetical protein VOLCADRAFT_85991 [Volvox carteri f. nagariensis]